MASPYDLVSLSAVQAWLDQTSDADNLSTLISQISRAILSLIGRPNILPALYVERRDGDGRQDLCLRNWPVVSIAELSIDGVNVQPAPAPAAGVAREPGYLLDWVDPSPPGQMQLLSLRGARFSGGRQNVQISYVAGYQVSSERAVIPGSPGPYAITAQQPFGAFAMDAGVSYADGGALTLVATPAQAGQYSVNAGVYSFSGVDAGRAVLLYYGYVPMDLAQAAMEWTAERYSYKSRIALRSKSLGGQETAAYDLSATPGFVETIIQPYRRIFWPC